jgi:predicted alpha/beta-hydrolase family hydrolase
VTTAPTVWTVSDGGDSTSVAYDPPVHGPARATFAFAHGAGGNMDDKAVVAMSAALCERGIATCRFNFFYRARGSGIPDPMPRLVACWVAVIESVRSALQPAPLLVGGRSMGGRAASTLVAEQRASCDGLLLLAYPLHPPGHPEKRRDAHLPGVRIPVLCINGTRDTFCDRPVMEGVLATLGANWQMHWLDGADHGFHVRKSSGRTDRDVVAEAADRVSRWDALEG